MTETLVVFSTASDVAAAEALAEALVADGLVACVNVLPAVRSVYVWQGRLERADEVLMVMKTTRERFPALRAAVVARHPYDVPEVVAVPVTAGHAPYLEWVTASCAAAQVPRGPDSAG